MSTSSQKPFSPAEHVDGLWMDHSRKLQFALPEWIPVGLGRAGGVCPGWEGYGQHLPGPPVHSLLHGVFTSVSVVVVVS